MKKSDLVSGKHYLKFKRENEVVLWLGDTILYDDLSHGYIPDIDENLVGIGAGKDYDDIIAVGERSLNGRLFKDINWIWERKPLMIEVKEVTMDELKDLLGYEVKIKK